MDGSVFDIKEMRCAYVHQEGGRKKEVLYIEDLSLPRGRITMILGLSGSGKSTLIETLGLMNNTLVDGSVIYHSAGESTRITPALWRHPQRLAAIRDRDFSFLFQNDFLMPYYTPEENMLLGKMIRDGKLPADSSEALLERRCREVRLDLEEISQQSTAGLSAGQKQRLAFVRAIVKDYTVLFGDEPTGNLDESTADLLMEALTRSVMEKPGRSAILVSHNLPLSVSWADQIVVLSGTGNGIYRVRPADVFVRSGRLWSNHRQESFSETGITGRIREIVMAKGADDAVGQPGEENRHG